MYSAVLMEMEIEVRAGFIHLELAIVLVLVALVDVAPASPVEPIWDWFKLVHRCPQLT